MVQGAMFRFIEGFQWPARGMDFQGVAEQSGGSSRVVGKRCQSSVLVCAGLSGFEETSAVSRLVPPLANRVLVIGHHSILEGGDPFLQRTQGLEERASIVAKDGGPEA